MSDPLDQGCGDHGCLIKKPEGMGTNGGCRCRPYKLGILINRQRAEIERLKKQYDYKDEVIEQRNAECSRQFKEIERLQSSYDLAFTECLWLEERNKSLRSALERISKWACIAPEDQRATVDIAREAIRDDRQRQVRPRGIAGAGQC